MHTVVVAPTNEAVLPFSSSADQVSFILPSMLCQLDILNQ
jgi:hypothetical protein